MASSAPEGLLGRLADAVAQRPLTALALTNGLTAAYALWVVSEGKPLAAIKKALFRAALAAVPKSLVDAEMGAMRSKIEASVVGHEMDGEAKFPALPEQGLPAAEVIAALDRGAATDRAKWANGQVSGSVYHGGDDLTAVIGEAFRRFALSNPLHPDLFPSVRKMESEVVSMTLRLFNAGPKGVGTVTSGGTESILMAVKAYRDHARATRGVTDPELVIPATAHAAFDKACDYFRVKLVKVPVDPTTFRADVRAMAAAVTRNTIGLVGSAPCFPQGVVDPITELGALAAGRGLPLHVDACLGSFLIACAADAGHPVPPFDFRVPGVASISADTHKYGFAPKGSSVVMYADPALRHAQYFVAPEWTGGIYASPTIAGSRAGALVVGCWATMVHVGRGGYVDAARRILGAAREIADGVRGTPGVELYGSPDLSVICFGPARAPGGGGKPLNIYNVADELTKRGWNLNSLQNPACLHLCVTYANAGSAARFVADLRAAVAAVSSAPPGTYKDGTAAIYGMADSIPDKSLVGEIAFSFLDALYKQA